MNENPLRLASIVGSVREGRFGPVVANWFAGETEQRGDVEIDVIDLAEVRDGGNELPERFASRIGAADAVVVVTPEYNHSFPASVKFAIDSLYAEWQAKPVGFVSYGGLSGGLRAVEHLRMVFAELHMVSVRETVSFHGARSEFDEAGRPREPQQAGAAAKALLDQLTWWAYALRQARAAHPYVA